MSSAVSSTMTGCGGYVAVLVADFDELVDDDAAEELFLGGEDGLVVGDVVADLGEFVEDLVDGELGEAVELQFEDGVDLAVAEDERAVDGAGRDGPRGASVVSMPYLLASSVTPASSVPRRLTRAAGEEG